MALEKRMQLLRSMGAFYDNEWPERDDEVVPHEETKVPEDMSTGIMKIFRDLPADKGYSTGTILSRCTALYIISRKGVYAVHWCENISFAPDQVWLEGGTTSEELFQWKDRYRHVEKWWKISPQTGCHSH